MVKLIKHSVILSIVEMINISSTLTHVKATDNDDVDAMVQYGWDFLSKAAATGDNPSFIMTKPYQVEETSYHNSSFRPEHHY